MPVAQRLPVQAGLSQLRERLNVAALSQQDNGEDDPAQRAIDRAELPAEAIAQGMTNWWPHWCRPYRRAGMQTRP